MVVVMRPLGPRRPVGSNMPPQNPSQNLSLEDIPDAAAPGQKTPSTGYHVYLSTIRAHDEAVARVQRKYSEETAPEQPPEQP